MIEVEQRSENESFTPTPRGIRLHRYTVFPTNQHGSIIYSWFSTTSGSKANTLNKCLVAISPCLIVCQILCNPATNNQNLKDHVRTKT